MQAEIVCDQSDHAKWLEARKTGIGSSDAPAILCLEKAFGNPFKISCLKRGMTIGDEEDTENELLKWGHYVEAPMIAAFSDETGHHGQLSGLMYRRAHPDLGMMMTTLDGVVTEKGGKVGGIECKNVIYTVPDWERDGVPEHVLCQTQHTMGVMDWDFMYVLALLDGYRLRYKRVERSKEVLGDVIEPAEKDFWTRLLADEEFDAGLGRSDQSGGFLKALHPADDGTTIQLKGDHWIETMDNWQIAKEDEKAGKKRAEGYKSTLIQGVGGATFARLDDGRRVSLKTTDRTGYEVKPTTYRTLRAQK